MSGHVFVSLNAGELTATGRYGDGGTAQYIMDTGAAYLHFTPETAAQWVTALTPLTKEK